jgi:hypothetical protein
LRLRSRQRAQSRGLAERRNKAIAPYDPHANVWAGAASGDQ